MARLRVSRVTLSKGPMKRIPSKEHEEAKAILTKDTCKIVDHHGRTLLHWAARLDNAAVARHLIELGCEVDPVDADLLTPLMTAVDKLSPKVVQVLLEANANFDYAASRERFSALQMVFLKKNCPKETGRVFLRHLRKITSTRDEYVNRLYNAGCTPYHAVNFNDIDLMKGLMAMSRHGVNQQGHRSRTALHAAVQLNDLSLVEWLIRLNGANVNVTDDQHLTPLYFLFRRSCKHEQTSFIRLAILNFLINIDATLTKFNIAGYPQLISIVKQGSVEAIDALIIQACIDNFDVNAKIGYHGKTLLHVLAKSFCPSVVEALAVKTHLDVNALDDAGRCPLFVAASRGNTAMVKFLLSRGADPDNRASRAHEYNPLLATFVDPLSTSGSKPHLYECTLLLLQHGADPQSSKPVTSDIFYRANVCDCNVDRIHLVIAHLVTVEMLGSSIDNDTRLLINSVPRFRRYYWSCRRVLDTPIFESLTFLDLLNLNNKGMTAYLRDKLFVTKMGRIGCKHQLQMTYSDNYSFMRERITKMVYAMSLDSEAATALNQIFNRYQNMHQIVIELLMAYFDKKELLKLLGKSVVDSFALQAE